MLQESVGGVAQAHRDRGQYCERFDQCLRVVTPVAGRKMRRSHRSRRRNLRLQGLVDRCRRRLRVTILDPGATRTRMRALAFPGEEPGEVKAPEVVANRLMELLAEQRPTGQKIRVD